MSLSDVVPAGTSFVSASNGGTNTAGTVTWSLGTIAANANKAVTLVVKVDPSRTTDISNTATATSGVSDPNTANNSAIEGTKVNASADLRVTKSDSPDPVFAGNNVTYTITVYNDGPSDATGVSLSDVVPAGTSFVSASNGGTNTAGTVTWSLGTIAANANKAVTLVVKVDPVADHRHLQHRHRDLRCLGPQHRQQLGDRGHQGQRLGRPAGHQVRLARPGVRRATTSPTRITVYNDGPSDATGVSLSDVVPAGTQLRVGLYRRHEHRRDRHLVARHHRGQRRTRPSRSW